jgi:hypothetical protein
MTAARERMPLALNWLALVVVCVPWWFHDKRGFRQSLFRWREAPVGLHSDCRDRLARSPFLLANLLNYPIRIAHRYPVSWNVPHHHAPRSNHAVVANGHTGTNDAMAPKPDVVPDVYGSRSLQSAAPNLWVNRMECCVDMNARPNLSIVPDGNEITVEEHAPVVDEPIATDADV